MSLRKQISLPPLFNCRDWRARRIETWRRQFSRARAHPLVFGYIRRAPEQRLRTVGSISTSEGEATEVEEREKKIMGKQRCNS